MTKKIELFNPLMSDDKIGVWHRACYVTSMFEALSRAEEALHMVVTNDPDRHLNRNHPLAKQLKTLREELGAIIDAFDDEIESNFIKSTGFVPPEEDAEMDKK